MKTEVIEHILKTGSELIHRHGFNKLGLQQILQEVGIPKGSFYYYFKSKEDFGLKVIEYYAAENTKILSQKLSDTSLTPKNRLIRLFEDMKEVYQKESFEKGCLLGNCSLELAAFKESYSSALEKEFSRWELLFVELINEGKDLNEIETPMDSSELASFILNSWEGALVRMKAKKSTQPLDILINYVKYQL